MDRRCIWRWRRYLWRRRRGFICRWATQILMMLTLMLTSKGVAGVPRASLVVLAATAASFGLPKEGVLLIFGVDTLMDMARTSVNMLGNCLAAAVLIGNVIVKNIAFNKWVAVRFTFDHWQTISEVSATYDSTQDNGTTPKDPAWDRFTFSIKLVDFTNLENRQMLFCVRYNVMDQEYWDNNYGSNYRVEFRKRPNHLLRRSPYPPNANGLYHRASDDSAIGEDFDIDISPETFAKDLAKQITSPRSALLANLGESPKFVKKTTSSSFPPLSSGVANGTPQKRLTGKAFANRYDFEASLSAAIANANTAIAAESSGLQKTSSPKITNSSDLYFPPLPPLFRPSPPVQSPIEIVKEVNLVNNIKKSHLLGLQQNHHFRSRSYPLGSPAQSSTMEDAWGGYNSDDGADKPPVDSSSYLDFISSYCFVCSSAIIC